VNGRSLRRRLVLLALAAPLAACVTLHDPAERPADLTADKVLVVGRIELVPPLRADEQRLFLGADPFNTRRYYQGRAVLFLADTPVERDQTGDAINPELEQGFAIAVPRSRRFVVGGGVAMNLDLRAVTARQAVLDRSDLHLPVPLEFDFRPGDRAIYIGTLRIHRDEFHSVVRAEVRDEYAATAAEHSRRFGPDVPLRRALLRMPPA
jgi:hypothetical protein